MENKREISRLKRHCRIRMRMHGDAAKPRLVVHRSLKNISAQVIDDTTSVILFSMSTDNKDIKQKIKSGGNVKASQYFGEVFAAKAKEKGIKNIIFDRAGYLYHGRIKAFAEALRKGGLVF